MLHCTWEMVCDRCNYFSFPTIFCPFSPNSLKNENQKKKKRRKNILEISSFYISVPKIIIRWCTITEIWCERCNCYFSFWAIFCTFTPLKAKKIKISEKKKKSQGNIIILQMCTKNYDQMMYDSWDAVRDRCNCYFSFWAIFCPFIPLTARKIKILKKWKRLLEISSSYIYKCTKNFDQMMYTSWDMLRNERKYI